MTVRLDDSGQTMIATRSTWPNCFEVSSLAADVQSRTVDEKSNFSPSCACVVLDAEMQCRTPETNQKQVLPKVIWEERVATAHGEECTRLLRVLRATSTADKSNHSAAGRLYPHCTDGHTSFSKAIGCIVPY